MGAPEKQRLYTSVYDRLQDKGWPAEFRARALRNGFGARQTGHEELLGPDSEARAVFKEARAAGDCNIAHGYAGQSVGLLDAVCPTQTIVTQAADLLLRWPSSTAL